MSDRMPNDLLGAVPELATLRLLGHAIATTLDLLEAMHHPAKPCAPPLPGTEHVEPLVAVLLEARDLVDDHAAAICGALLRRDDEASDLLDDDIF